MTSGKDRKTIYPQGNGPGDSFLDNQFAIDCDEDFLITSVRMYKYFLANGKDGLEAKQLYDHLLFTARVQGSKKVKANLSYIKNGLGWGNAKVKNAKAFLRAAGLIEYVQEKDDSGQFDGGRIILKSSWNIESFKAWIEKREQREAEKLTAGSEIEPTVDNKPTGGSEIEPVEHMGSSEREDTICPVGQSTVQRLTDPTVSEHNYKGSYKKEILPQSQKHEVVDNSDPEPPSLPPPSASSPPAANINTVEEMRDALVDMVKQRDPDSMFCFMPVEMEKLAIAFKLHGPEWVIEVFNEYLKTKSISQVNRFHGEDIPRFIQRYMDRQKRKASRKMISKEPVYHHCPCCGKTWSASSTLSMCPTCGLELKDFSNHAEIEAHKEWWSHRSKDFERDAG